MKLLREVTESVEQSLLRLPKLLQRNIIFKEKIVAQMESGKLSLEDSLTAYERGASLLNFCREAIARAEQQVQVLENGVMKPFLAGGDE